MLLPDPFGIAQDKCQIRRLADCLSTGAPGFDNPGGAGE